MKLGLTNPPARSKVVYEGPARPVVAKYTVGSIGSITADIQIAVLTESHTDRRTQTAATTGNEIVYVSSGTPIVALDAVGSFTDDIEVAVGTVNHFERAGQAATSA